MLVAEYHVFTVAYCIRTTQSGEPMTARKTGHPERHACQRQRNCVRISIRMSGTDANSPRADDLEAKLAGSVRSYIRSSDPTEKEEALRWVCTGLEHLLGMVLAGCSGWSGWVDGILPATDMLPQAIEVISPVALSIRGCALWAKSDEGPFWIEPFHATVQISDVAEGTIVDYDLMFADAARESGTVLLDKHLRRPDWFFPSEWLFTFSKAPRVLK